ncbi:hypothetical protein ACWEIJ_45895 [Lentzea sp. NPDC004789]
MSKRLEDLVLSALKTLPPKPGDDATQGAKRSYSQQMSAALAAAVAEELRHRGMSSARPGGPGELGKSGAERRISGGIGAKKVDVTWATEESGLLLGVSIKTINFRDVTSQNFQKNLINRRGDLLVEAVTLHRRFPYAVLAGLLVLDKAAASDSTDKRRSTLANAFPRLRLFTGRSDPAGRDEQFERLYLLLVDANKFHSSIECYRVDNPSETVPLASVFDDLVSVLIERNFDFYEADEHGGLRKMV